MFNASGQGFVDMLLIIQTHIVPAISRRERGGFGALLVTIFLAKIPVRCLNGQHRNSRFIEDLSVIATTGAFGIVLIQARITGGGNAMIARNR